MSVDLNVITGLHSKTPKKTDKKEKESISET